MNEHNDHLVKESVGGNHRMEGDTHTLTFKTNNKGEPCNCFPLLFISFSLKWKAKNKMKPKRKVLSFSFLSLAFVLFHLPLGESVSWGHNGTLQISCCFDEYRLQNFKSGLCRNQWGKKRNRTLLEWEIKFRQMHLKWNYDATEARQENKPSWMEVFKRR